MARYDEEVGEEEEIEEEVGLRGRALFVGKGGKEVEEEEVGGGRMQVVEEEEEEEEEEDPLRGVARLVVNGGLPSELVEELFGYMTPRWVMDEGV